jgi:hypothetical protein
LRQFLDFLRAPAPADADEGQTSSVTTSLFVMTLNHDTGHMDGEILDGPWVGKRLSDLAPNQLFDLYHDCRHRYPDSMAVLEAYLDRTLGPDWRQEAASKGDPPRGAEELTRDEAFAILGIEPGATEQEIILAHRRMMQKVHPDRGGSDYLAAKVNRAKDMLLKG